MSALLALLVFLALILCGYAAAVWAREQGESREALDRRLATMTGTTSIGASRSGTLLKDERLSGIAVLNSLLGRISLVRPLVKTIRQAGLKKRAGEILLYIPLLACCIFLLTLLVGGSPRIGLLLALVGGFIPIVVVRRMRAKRMMMFAEQLPNALDLLRAALQAGHGLLTAIQVVADEFPDPIASELREVSDEVRLGLPFRDALYHLAERIDDPNLPILVIGILITQEVGGNLAEVLDNITYTIRERFKLLREIRVMTAQGRLSGGVLTALPFIVAGALTVLNPEYVKVLIDRPTGHWMIGYALGSVFVGHLLIRRLVTQKV
jgi:tight adherence protein B